MPGIVLATGFFLLFNSTIGLPENARRHRDFHQCPDGDPLRAEGAGKSDARHQQPLRAAVPVARSAGLARLKIIELRALKRPLAQALAFACVLSIGDFGVVALFGNEDFRTLPYWLYQQIGSYRSQEGAVTALLLLVLCFALFTVIEKLPGRNVKTD